jgi:hypothetical protein
VYRIVTYREAVDQVAALPDRALADYLHVLEEIGSRPWDGPSHHAQNPHAEVRHWFVRG